MTRILAAAAAAIVSLSALAATSDANAQWTKPKGALCDMIIDGKFVPCTAGS